MVKIPTYTAKGRITAETGSVKSNIKVSPYQTAAGAVSGLARAAEDYYIKQRDNNDKLEAKKKFYEMKAESDRVIDKYKNNTDEFAAVSGYNLEFGFYRDQQLSQIKNKRVKKRLETMLNIDNSENIYKIKSNSFAAFEREDNQVYDTEQNSLAAEYSLATNAEIKAKKKNQRQQSAKDFAERRMMGNVWLNNELKKIETDTVMLDVDKAVSLGNYQLALKLLQESDKEKVDAEQLQKKIITIQSKIATANENNFNANANSAIANTNFSDLGKLSDTIITSTGDTKKDASNKAKFKNVIEKAQKLIDKEGAAEFYVNNDANLAQLNSIFNQSYSKAIMTISNSSATEEQKQQSINLANESFDEFARETNKKYDMLNVPKEKRTLLTNAAITNLKQRIDGAEGPNQKLSVIQEIKTIYGDHTPTIMKQIKNQIGPSVAFAMSVDDPDLKFSAAQGIINDEEKKIFNSKLKGKMDNAEIEIAKTVRDELEPFTQILIRQGNMDVNAAQIVDDIVLNVSTAVQRKVINTLEPVSSSEITKIAKDYAKKFMGDYDLTNDTYWIPTRIGDKAVNQGFFEAKMEVFKTALKYDQIDFSNIAVRPIGDGVSYKSKEETIKFFKDNGQIYLSNNDEVVFGVKDDNGVIHKFMYSSELDDSKARYKPLTFKFLDNSENIGDFDKLDMENIYDYINMADPNIPEEALLP